jgi:hypothetical protein
MSTWSDASLVAAYDAIDDIAESDWHIVMDIDRVTDHGLRNSYPPVAYITSFGEPAKAKKIASVLLTDHRMRQVWQKIDQALEFAHEALIQRIERLSSRQRFDFDTSKFDKDESKISCLIARQCVREITMTSLADSKAKYAADLRKISDDLQRIGERLRHDTHFSKFSGRTAGEPLLELDVLSKIAFMVADHPPDLRRGGLAQTRKLNLIDTLGQVFLKVFDKPMDAEVADIVSVVTGTDVNAAEVKTERTRYHVDPISFVYR